MAVFGTWIGGAAWAAAQAQSTEAAVVDAPAQRARAAVERGETLFKAHNYDAALTEFSAAYEWLEGDPRRYLILNNIAVCHERMFRYDLALAFYSRYLSEGGPEARDRADVERVLRTLRTLLARLEIAANVRADLWIDDRHVGRAPGVFLIPAGKHVVELRAGLHEAVRREVQLAAGGSKRLVMSLQRLSQFEGIHPVYFWSGVALTAGALAVTAVSGIDALTSHAAADSRRVVNPVLNTIDDENHIKHKALVADLGLAGVALFGATSVVLYLLTDWRGGSERGAGLRVACHPTLDGSRFAGWEAQLVGRY